MINKLVLPLLMLASCNSELRFGVAQPFQPAGQAIDPSADGPFAVSLLRDAEVHRGGRPDFALDLFFPGTETGALDDSLAPYPVVVFVQGGLVARDQYHWISARLASWGFVVAVPQYPAELAFFGKSRTHDTVDALEQFNQGGFFQETLDLKRLAVGGHSLGGVVADRAIDKDQRFKALFMFGSFPGDKDGADFQGATLSVAGGADCLTTTEKALDGISLYNAPKAYAEIAGVTHFQFTADETKDIEDGCLSGISLDEAHAKISALTVSFLRSALAGDDQFLSVFTTPEEGVTIEATPSQDLSFSRF
jgi:dienelactone hydrolase